VSSRILPHEALPDAFKRLVNLHEYVERTAAEEGLDPVLIELVKTRASQINGCAYCADMHARDGARHGETARRLAVLPVWRETELFTTQERAALALTEAISHLSETRDVPDEVYAEAAEVFSERQLAVVIWAASLIQTFNGINVTGRKPLPEQDWSGS
jgi:AhpD family alkylhydroperoxidase